MHHPPCDNELRYCGWNSEYDWVKNANLIIAGHWHTAYSWNNVKVFKALTEHKKLNYEIISL